MFDRNEKHQCNGLSTEHTTFHHFISCWNSHRFLKFALGCAFGFLCTPWGFIAHMFGYMEEPVSDAFRSIQRYPTVHSTHTPYTMLFLEDYARWFRGCCCCLASKVKGKRDANGKSAKWISRKERQPKNKLPMRFLNFRHRIAATTSTTSCC